MDNFLTRLRAGSPQWGFIVSYPAPGIVERVGRDWDWVWIDGQHGQLGYQDILALVRVCDGLGRPPFVRVASHEYAEIGRTMDMNVSGLIVPMVQNAAEARRVIAAAKYPPLGDRSYGGRRVGDLRGRHYPQDVNADVIVLLQIETEEGLRNADEIAAIPGVDGLFYGPDDVLVRRGLPMDTPKTPETLGADLRTVAEACRRQGKIAATLAFTPALIEFCVRSGYRLVAAGADIAMLTGGSQQASA
ncbi:MAG: hypothetical protein JNG83_11345, partial [Opitutaceae bacterium]|nr:hypothetical protein [Opitutaceae bacterium]